MRWQARLAAGGLVWLVKHKQADGAVLSIGEDGTEYVPLSGLRLAPRAEVEAANPGVSLKKAIRRYVPARR